MKIHSFFKLIAAFSLIAVISCGSDGPEKAGSSYDDFFGGGGSREKEPEDDGNYLTEGKTTLALPHLMSDHMVLQQQCEANIWGKATPGAKVTVIPDWDNRQYSVKVPTDGKWVVRVPTPKASKDAHTIRITDSQGGGAWIRDVLVGEVWMTTGQSNMEQCMRGFGSVAEGNYQPILNFEEELKDADIPTFRYFKDKYQLKWEPQDDTNGGEWSVSNPTSALEFEAIAYFFGRRLSRELDVPIGIIGCAYGGSRIEAWMSQTSLDKFPVSDWKDAADLGLAAGATNKQAPTNIYNGMVLPAINYTIKGWLWYQGESNRDNYKAYPQLQREMVADWRALKGDDSASIPFFFVQLAGYQTSDMNQWYNMRDAQLKAYDILPNSGIVNACDCSGPTVHYPDKRTPAERLAMWAENKVYGISSVNPMAPRFKAAVANGNKIIVTLTDATGLKMKEGATKINEGQIQGGDGKWYDATITIEGDKMVFSASGVTSPKAVTYCARSVCDVTLYNAAGLPVFPFKATL